MERARRRWGQFKSYRAFSVLTLAITCAVIVPFVLFGEAIGSWSEAHLSGPRAEVTLALSGAALLASDPILPIPSSIVATLLGNRLGFWSAALSIWAGLSAGAALGIAIGRGGAYVAPRPPERIEAWMRQKGVAAVLICRPVPVLAEVSLVVAGMTGIPVRRTMLWLFAANLGLAFLYAGFGALEARSPIPGLALTLGAVGIPAGFGAAALLLSRFSMKRIPGENLRP